MYFLIEYDRSLGRLVKIERFNTTERQSAENSRLNLELDLNRRGIDHEVVLLDAASEDALQRTHRRYFESLSELINSPSQ